jgi:hypothetical protein
MKCLTTSSKKSAFFQRHSEALHSFSKEISKRNSKVFFSEEISRRIILPMLLQQ